MKKIIFIVILLSGTYTFSQVQLDLKGTANKKINSEIREGDEVTLTGMGLDGIGLRKAYFESNARQYEEMADQIKKVDFAPATVKDFWQLRALEEGVYASLVEHGMQYNLRSSVQKDALKYDRWLQERNLIYEDAYLESYLQALVFKLFPLRLNDGRSGVLRVRIEKSNIPNAMVYPTGTIYITTGLLSVLRSEEELLAILAHEIAHWALDHWIININAAIERQERAEAWALFATSVAAMADVYVAFNNDYYEPGLITALGGTVSSIIAAEVLERLGIEYNHEQELKADQVATELLNFIGINPSALSTALSRIAVYNYEAGNYSVFHASYTHPKLGERIEILGNPESFKSTDFDIHISFINTHNAILEFNNLNLDLANELVDRNISAGVAVADDYLIKAKSIIYMYDNTEKNKEALGLLNKASELNSNNPGEIYKNEAILYLRLGQNSKAKESLINFKRNVENSFHLLEVYKGTDEVYRIHEYLTKDLNWADNMLQKVELL